MARIPTRAHRPRRLGIALAAVVALLLSACGTPDGKSAGGDKSVLTFAFAVGPSDGFDPDFVANPTFLSWLFPIYDSLIEFTPDGELKPMLASSWEVTPGKIKFTLIEDWEFHDGQPFNADAVVANIERSKSVEGSLTAPALAAVTSAEAVDERTVVLNIDGSAAPILTTLSGAAGMMESPAEYDRADFKTKPTGGSGQFKLEENVLDQYTSYTAVPEYWDKDLEGSLDGIRINLFADDTRRLGAVVDGQANIAFIRPEQLKDAKSAELTILSDRSSLQTYFFALNNSRGPLADVRVRKAMAHAINIEEITDDLLEGLCTPTTQLYPSFYWPGSPDIPDIAYKHDVEAAKKLLAEAGQEKGFKLKVAVNDLPLYQNIAAVLQSQLKQVGIDLSIEPMAADVAREAYEIDKKYDAQINQTSLPIEPSLAVAQSFFDDGSKNPGGFEAPGVRDLAKQGLAGATDEERAGSYHELMQLGVDNVYPNVNLCAVTNPYVTDGTVNGLVLSVDGLRRLRGVTLD